VKLQGPLTIAVLSDSSGKLPKFSKWAKYSVNVNRVLIIATLLNAAAGLCESSVTHSGSTRQRILD
jgi:hypothetical protein